MRDGSVYLFICRLFVCCYYCLLPLLQLLSIIFTTIRLICMIDLSLVDDYLTIIDHWMSFVSEIEKNI